jgi:hypothetical protein
LKDEDSLKIIKENSLKGNNPLVKKSLYINKNIAFRWNLKVKKN